MKTKTAILILCAVLLATSPCFAKLYGDPPDAMHPWQIHDENREDTPKVVTPGENLGDPPADAVILFDGTDLSNWQSDKKGEDGKPIPLKWRLVNGELESVKGAGYIRTKESFGDCQLHVEWATPIKVSGNSQGRGNSGVFLMGIYEVQVLDNDDNYTYPDGQAGSVYGQNPPLVNVCRGPGQWQAYDIIFRQPRLEDGKLVRPGYITVFQNGVVVQDHWVLEGPSGHKRRTKLRVHPDKGPFKIQDHGNPVRFRNIWIRELSERSDGGLKGPYTCPEAVKAKRAETAAKIRDKAKVATDKINKMQLLMESLAYECCPLTTAAVETMLGQYFAPLKDARKSKVEKQRETILALKGSLDYLTKFKIVKADFGSKPIADKLVEKYELNKRRR